MTVFTDDFSPTAALLPTLRTLQLLKHLRRRQWMQRAIPIHPARQATRLADSIPLILVIPNPRLTISKIRHDWSAEHCSAFCPLGVFLLLVSGNGKTARSGSPLRILLTRCALSH